MQNEKPHQLVWYYNNILGRPQKKRSSRAGPWAITGRVDDRIADRLSAVFTTKIRLLPMNPRNPHGCALLHRARTATIRSRLQTAQCAQPLEAQIQAEGPDTNRAFNREPVLGTGASCPRRPGYWTRSKRC